LGKCKDTDYANVNTAAIKVKGSEPCADGGRMKRKLLWNGQFNLKKE
jgi:hypothetical protein